MKLTGKQLRQIIYEAKKDSIIRRVNEVRSEGLVTQQAQEILNLYDQIHFDLGAIGVDELINYWVEQGNPKPVPGVRDEIIRINFGKDILR